MKNCYFESLKTYEYGEYLGTTPKKSEVINNASVEGNAYILPNSNNRALVIESGSHVFLQSYDTLIIDVDKERGTISKMWNGYSVTTLKHINEFLSRYGLSFSKKSWESFNGTTVSMI